MVRSFVLPRTEASLVQAQKPSFSFDLLIVLVFFAFWGGFTSARAAEHRCAKAERIIGLGKNLPSLHAKIVAGEPIRIVALGSSSTEGTPDIAKGDIYPAVLERSLSRELMVPVTLINKGKGGDTIARMVARLENDVVAQKPDLLIWQLGVNDVLTMDGVASPISLMRDTLARLKALGIPVILVDLQLSPILDNDRDTSVMQAAIAEASEVLGVMHFRRHAMMEKMSESADITPAELVERDGLHMSALAHYCTGLLLAKQIARASFVRQSAGLSNR